MTCESQSFQKIIEVNMTECLKRFSDIPFAGNVDSVLLNAHFSTDYIYIVRVAH